PHGTRLAAAARDGAGRNRDTATGRTTGGRRGGEVSDVAWSPDGTRLVTALREGAAVVWRADGSDDGMTLTGHSEEISNVAWSPDGTRIATASRDGTARVWDAASGATLHVLRGHQD